MQKILIEISATVLTTLLSAGLLLVIARLSPARPQDSADWFDSRTVSFYRRILVIENLLLLAAAAALTFLFWPLYRDIPIEWKGKTALLILKPAQNEWLIPAMFSGLVISVIIAIPAEKLFLKDKNRDFQAWKNKSSNLGIDLENALKYIIVIMIWLIFQFTILMRGYYAVLTPNSLVINRFFSLHEEVILFSGIDSIITAPQFTAPAGNLVTEPVYVVRFRNGKKYNSVFLPGKNRNTDMNFFETLSHASGIKIIQKNYMTTKEVY